MTLELTRTELLRTQQIVDGEWQDAVTGRRFAVTNPATGQIIAQVADAAPADARAAVDAAERALPAWRAKLPAERAAFLRRWHAAIIEHREDLARLISMEQGKPSSICARAISPDGTRDRSHS